MATPMTAAQGSDAPTWSAAALLVVGLCFAINMVDGMDVVIMSYISPALKTTPSASGATPHSRASAGEI